jgi:hypothetical protein
LLLAVAVITLRTLVFPRWLGWVTLALGIAVLVPWVGWFAYIFLFPVWIILLSVWMWSRPVAAPVAS